MKVMPLCRYIVRRGLAAINPQSHRGLGSSIVVPTPIMECWQASLEAWNDKFDRIGC